MKFFKYFVLALIFTGCSVNNQIKKEAINPCKNLEFPNWTSNQFVGSSRITASGNKSQQKDIAIRRALSTLLMSKGNAQGSGDISSIKIHKNDEKNDSLRTSYEERNYFNIKYANIDYSIRLKNLWENPCTKEIYVEIERN